jgi:hypothetical protein
LKSSIGKYCESAYIDSLERNVCDLEFGKLCCSMSSNIFKEPLNEDAVKECTDKVVEMYEEN